MVVSAIWYFILRPSYKSFFRSAILQGSILPTENSRKFSVFGKENFICYRGNIIGDITEIWLIFFQLSFNQRNEFENKVDFIIF